MRQCLMFGATLLLSSSLAMAQPGGERPAGGEGGRGGFGGPPSNPLFDAIDKDKDGNISAAELEGAVAALKTLDRNGDGIISREEARPQGGNFGRGAGGGFGGGQFSAEDYIARMMERDTNKDGKLSAEELGERGARMLETGDTNGDKHIDAEELKAAAARMAEQFRSGGNRGGRPGGDRGGRPGGEGGNRQRPGSNSSNDRI